MKRIILVLLALVLFVSVSLAESISISLQSLSDDELEDLIENAQLELNRRKEMPVASYIWNKKDALQSKSAGIIEATFELPVPVPKPLHLTYEEYIDITLTDYHVKVILRPFSGSMYHFFPDYRNYYYLPEEDTAIHKSVASFVAASHREKAKAQSCYVKKQGTFLPLAGESKLPAFQRYYKDPVLWFEYIPDEKPDSAAFSEYIHRLIRDLVSG